MAAEAPAHNPKQRHRPSGFTRLMRRVTILADVSLVLSVPGVAFITSLITDFGRGAGDQFFIVLAQVLPVLWLAAVVEAGLASREPLERATPEETNLWLSGLFSTTATLFVVGEACLLYAVSEQEATTFLVVTPVLAVLLVISDVLGAVRQRLGFSEREGFDFDKEAQRWGEITQERIGHMRRRAKTLTKDADRLQEDVERLQQAADDHVSDEPPP